MVHIEERPLSAFEENFLPGFDLAVEQHSRVGDVLFQLLAVAAIGFVDLREVQGFLFQDRLEVDVLLLDVAAQLVAERRPVEKIDKTDAGSGDLVFVGRADAATGSADFSLAPESLPGLIDGLVVGHDQVGLVADPEQRVLQQVASCSEPADLLEQHLRIDHDAVADHAELARVKSAGWDQVQDRFFAVDDERVAGVVAALKTDDDVRVPAEEVDDLAFALVSPLSPDDSDVSHFK